MKKVQCLLEFQEKIHYSYWLGERRDFDEIGQFLVLSGDWLVL